MLADCGQIIVLPNFLREQPMAVPKKIAPSAAAANAIAACRRVYVTTQRIHSGAELSVCAKRGPRRDREAGLPWQERQLLPAHLWASIGRWDLSTKKDSFSLTRLQYPESSKSARCTGCK